MSSAVRGEADTDDRVQDWVDHQHFEELDSTQTYVEREYLNFDQTKLTVVSADFQTAGRGTGERQWHATKGLSILATAFFRFPAECETSFVNRNVTNTTKVATLAALESLKFAAFEGQAFDAIGQPLRFGLKWPNDVVVNDCKIGGVLARALPTGNRLDGVIVGIGINVNTPQADLDAIERPVWPATSLHAISGGNKIFDVSAMREHFVRVFARELRAFFVGGFAACRERVNNLDVLLGTQVRFRAHGSAEFEAVFEGVDDEGLILLRLDSGVVQAYPSGEIIPRIAVCADDA